MAASGLSCSVACGILVTQSGIRPGSLQWEYGVLATGTSGKGKSPFLVFLPTRTTMFVDIQMTADYGLHFSCLAWLHDQTFVMHFVIVRMSLVAQTVKNLTAMWESWVQSLGWEDSLEEDIANHSSILAWRIPMDRRARWATVHRIANVQTRLND